MGKKRARHGSVRAGIANGTWRLRFTYQGQRYVISLGLSDTPYHRHLASQRAHWMEREIEYGRFDPSNIDLYRQVLHGPRVLDDELPPPPVPPLSQLWQQYSTVKSPGKAPSTVRGYVWVAGHIERLPVDDLRQSQTIVDAITKLTTDVQKRLFTQLNACLNWAKGSELIDYNPFMGRASMVKSSKRGNVDEEVRPFSKAERDAIIEAFRQSSDYQHYANLVSFLFFTGARPSEAIPLTWSNVGAEHILFDQSRTYDGRKYVIKKRLKTQEYRRFPISSQLQGMISGMERGSADSLVFPSPKDSYINWSNFTRRAWAKTMEGLPGIEYRNPYQMRHSFISYCRELNIPSVTIADWVGNSAEVIDRVYARSTQAFGVPEL